MNNKPTILIVEDDRFLERMYSSKLEREGMNVLNASDGEEALAMMRQNIPAVVLLDIIMPKMDGLQVLKEMRASERLKNVSVILLTNLGEAENVRQARALGANDYLVKLPDRVELVARIRAMLRRPISIPHRSSARL